MKQTYEKTLKKDILNNISNENKIKDNTFKKILSDNIAPISVIIFSSMITFSGFVFFTNSKKEQSYLPTLNELLPSGYKSLVFTFYYNDKEMYSNTYGYTNAEDFHMGKSCNILKEGIECPNFKYIELSSFYKDYNLVITLSSKENFGNQSNINMNTKIPYTELIDGDPLSLKLNNNWRLEIQHIYKEEPIIREEKILNLNPKLQSDNIVVM